MRRVLSCLLLLGLLGLCTGFFRYVHEANEAAEDARASLFARAHPGTPAPEKHDEAKCELCFQLNMALSAAGWIPVLIAAGLLIAFLSEVAPVSVACVVLTRFGCRGPPSVLSPAL